jgi:hypothetical protein
MASPPRLSPDPSRRGQPRSCIGCVPGAVIAVGVLVPLGHWTMDAAGLESVSAQTGLLLTGTIVALVYAYLVHSSRWRCDRDRPDVTAHGRRGALARRERGRRSRACTRRCCPPASRPRHCCYSWT